MWHYEVCAFSADTGSISHLAASSCWGVTLLNKRILRILFGKWWHILITNGKINWGSTSSGLWAPVIEESLHNELDSKYYQLVQTAYQKLRSLRLPLRSQCQHNIMYTTNKTSNTAEVYCFKKSNILHEHTYMVMMLRWLRLQSENIRNVFNYLNVEKVMMLTTHYLMFFSSYINNPSFYISCDLQATTMSLNIQFLHSYLDFETSLDIEKESTTCEMSLFPSKIKDKCFNIRGDSFSDH